MAQKVTVSLEDDLDGGEADGTIDFSFDGADYQIDLSPDNRDRLRASLTPFIEAARRTGGRNKATRNGNAGTPARKRAADQELRAWGKEHFPDDVADRGRIPGWVKEKFAAAQES